MDDRRTGTRRSHGFASSGRIGERGVVVSSLTWMTNIPESIYTERAPNRMIRLHNGSTVRTGLRPVRIRSALLRCPNCNYHGPVERVVDKQIAVCREVTYKITETMKATVGFYAVSKGTSTGKPSLGGPFLGKQDRARRTDSSEKPVIRRPVFLWQPTRNNLLRECPIRVMRLVA